MNIANKYDLTPLEALELIESSPLSLTRMRTVVDAINNGQPRFSPSYGVKNRHLIPFVVAGLLKQSVEIEYCDDAMQGDHKTYRHYALTPAGKEWMRRQAI